MQHHDRLLPVRRFSETAASAAGFTLNIGRPDIRYLNVVQAFDRAADLHLVRLLVDLKRISILDIRKMHSLLGHQRSDNCIKFVHATVLPCLVLFPVQQRYKRILGKKHLLLVADDTRVQIADHHNIHLRKIPGGLVNI